MPMLKPGFPERRFFNAQPASAGLLPFWILSWVHMMVLSYPYFQSGFEGRLVSLNTLFHITAWPFYTMLYLLPAAVLTTMYRKLFPGHTRVYRGLLVFLTVLSLLYIWTDKLIFNLYAFHINSFVLNLVMTAGGVDSLNSSNSTLFAIGLVVVRVILVQSALLLICFLRLPFDKLHGITRPLRLTTVLLGLFLVQGITYGICDISNEPEVLDHAYDYPFFQKIRFRSLAGKFGYTAISRDQAVAYSDNSRLKYPLAEAAFRHVENPPNIVWLVAESLRWDQLSEDVMPNTSRFAAMARNYKNHYSSGNGTREGMFGMFYGLYGSYWNNFLNAKQSPILIDRMQALGYTFEFRTAAKFTYPEFDKTILANIPASNLHEAEDALSPWQRDEDNTTSLINFIQQQDDGAPFMAFQFFESTHAPYFFPDHSAIQHPYIESVNYADLSKDYLDDNIGLILARYRNSGHWLDIQLGRIIDSLQANIQLENTIVIITGDHGEEFMEKGSWGHNSSFVKEQTHVPFILWMPGKEAEEINKLTSHLDIATTLLQELGADSRTENYSLGMNLFDESQRDYVNISDWHSIGVVTKEVKVRIPYLSTGLDYWPPTDQIDLTLDSQQSRLLMTRYRESITTAIENTSLFSRAN